MVVETSKAFQDVFYCYTHLPIGGKEIVCPYWMNNLKDGVFGPYGGKGTPKQIEETVKHAAEIDGLDLYKMSLPQIVNYMKEKRIGVDCSGYVFWMLNSLDLEKGGNGIADDIAVVGDEKTAWLRANVMALTDPKVSFSVPKVSEVRVGDMIRMRGGKHILIVTALHKENGEIKEVEYSHSSSAYTKISGVHKSTIKVINKNDGVEKQLWLEEIRGYKRNYSDMLFPLKGDGIKRINIWD